MHAIKRFFSEFLDRHQDKLWWFHSSYSLLLGIGVMWLGTKNFAYLRLAVFHIAFIWLSSLALPLLARLRRLPENWRRRLRLLINYFQRNFYQQLLFFILPIYYLSATWGAGNMLFVLLLAVSALLATMDIVYDRYLSVNGWLLAVFFAFNLFACINVMLPVIWNFKNSFALRLSALLALAGFASFSLRPARREKPRPALAPDPGRRPAAGRGREVGRPLIPPAPLRLVESGFGLGWDEQKKRLSDTLRELPAGGPRKILRPDRHPGPAGAEGPGRPPLVPGRPAGLRFALDPAQRRPPKTASASGLSAPWPDISAGFAAARRRAHRGRPADRPGPHPRARPGGIARQARMLTATGGFFATMKTP